MANANEGTKKAIEKVEDKVNQTASDVQNKVSTTQDKVADLASATSNTVQKAQDFVNDKATQINDYAHQAYDKAYDTANKLGTRATDAYNASADYVRNIDVEKARETVKTAVKEKPELSIAIAALTGLVIGLLIGRSGGDRN